jgi:HEPN domain-containing protein
VAFHSQQCVENHLKLCWNISLNLYQNLQLYGKPVLEDAEEFYALAEYIYDYVVNKIG